MSKMGAGQATRSALLLLVVLLLGVPPAASALPSSWLWEQWSWDAWSWDLGWGWLSKEKLSTTTEPSNGGKFVDKVIEWDIPTNN